MTRQVRVTQKDIPLIQEIFDALATALENLPEKLMKNEKFSVLAMTAIFNIACRVAQKSGVPREEFMSSIGKVWDDKAAAAKEKIWN
jgi:hypothetical protein